MIMFKGATKQKELELEHLHSENTTQHLMITHSIDSYSQKTKSKLQI